VGIFCVNLSEKVVDFEFFPICLRWKEVGKAINNQTCEELLLIPIASRLFTTLLLRSFNLFYVSTFKQKRNFVLFPSKNGNEDHFAEIFTTINIIIKTFVPFSPQSALNIPHYLSKFSFLPEHFYDHIS
jgi:hypothetical protein